MKKDGKNRFLYILLVSVSTFVEYRNYDEVTW